MFWVGGNNAQTNALCTGVNVNDNDDSDKCAQLKPNVKMNIFAAGNLFTGTFDCGTGLLDTFGHARFGVQYTFTARPRAPRLRYKATVTNITNTGNSGLTTNDIDSARVFVCVIDWTGRHAVKIGSIVRRIHILGPGDQVSLQRRPDPGLFHRKNSGSQRKVGRRWNCRSSGMTRTRPRPQATIHWSSPVLRATKGDYVTGSTSNLLCVENFEWVY